MSKVVMWVGAIFALIGLLFMAVGGWLYWEGQNFAETALHAQGKVIELSRGRDSKEGNTYRPIVEFYDSKGARHEFIGQVATNPPSYSSGEAVEVIYAPNAPAKARLNNSLERIFLPSLMGGMGTIFAILGFSMLYFFWRRRKIIARLRQSGIPIQAKFIESYRAHIKINGRRPYRVVVEGVHPVNGKQSFKSDPIWPDLSEELTGKTIPVMIDPAQPKHYFVDLSNFIGPKDMA